MKKKCLIVMGGMSIGGAQKSLINFLYFIRNFIEIDLLLWDKSIMKYKIPDGINIITDFPTVKSVKAALKIDGFFSKSFLFSLLAAVFYKKRWLCSPKIKKHYDFAIAYTTTGSIKYFVIDKVNANRKFLWYHHGSYEQVGKIKKLDNEYFPKYDNLITVSNSNKEMLSTHFPKLKEKILVVQNLLNEKEIIDFSKQQIDDFDDFDGLKLTTVGRLSEEKGQLFALEIASELKIRNVNFKWIFVGDGDLRTQVEKKIKEYNLSDFCILVGDKENPYPYIKNCDIYIQPSFIESYSLTIYEAIILNKYIVATRIPAILEALCNYRNAKICEFEPKKIAKVIMQLGEKLNINPSNFQIENINNSESQKILKYLFDIV